MAMSVVYSIAFGGVFAENRGGVVSMYVPDTQGSTIGLVSSSGVLTDRWVYWPYGEVATRTGTNATPLTWLGTLGYYLDQVSKLFYVRARHLRADLARWLTVDPLWPGQPAFAYCEDAAVGCTDRSGLQSCPPGQITSSQLCGSDWDNPFVSCSPPTFGWQGACCASATVHGGKLPGVGCCEYLCRSWTCSCVFWPSGLTTTRGGVDTTFLSGPQPGYCLAGNKCVASITPNWAVVRSENHATSSPAGRYGKEDSRL